MKHLTIVIIFCLSLNFTSNGQSFKSVVQELKSFNYTHDYEKDFADSLVIELEQAIGDTNKMNVVSDISNSYLTAYYEKFDSIISTSILKISDSILLTDIDEKQQQYFNYSKATATYYLSCFYYDIQDIATSDSLVKISYELFSAIGDTLAMMMNLNQISLNQSYVGKDLEAIITMEQSLGLIEQVKDSSYYRIGILNNLGSTFRDVGQINKAIDTYNKAIQFCYEINDFVYLTTLYGDIASCFRILDEDSLAIHYLYKALEYTNYVELVSDKTDVFVTLGLVYSSQNRHDSTIMYMDSVLYIEEQYGMDQNLFTACCNLSEIYVKKENYNKAQDYCNKAETLINGEIDESRYAYVLFLKGFIKEKQKQNKKALSYYKQAYNKIKSFKYTEYYNRILWALYKAYRKNGEFKNALSIHEKVIESEMRKENIVNQKSLWKFQYQSEYEAQAREDSLRHEQQMQVAALELQNTQYKNKLWSSVAGGVFLLALAIILWLRARAQKRLEERNAKAKAEVVKAMIVGQEKERSRISKELHDGVGADLLAAKFKLNSQQNTPGYEILENTISSIRNFSHDLIPPRLDLHSIEEYLAEYFNALRDDVPFNIQYNHIGNFKKLNIDEKITLYRITQECLTNIIKHAEASEVIAQLTEENGNITLLIEDDGKGFDSTKLSDGIGLSNIKSRIELLGGNVQVDSMEGKGTTILVQF